MPSDLVFDYEGQVTIQQVQDLSAAGQRRLWNTAHWRGAGYILAAGIVYALSLVGIYALAQSIDSTPYAEAPYTPDALMILGMLVGIAFTVFVIMLFNIAHRRLTHRHGFHAGGSYCGPRRFRINAEGIQVAGPHGQSFTYWDAVTELTETPRTLLFWTDTLVAVMIPKRTIGDEQEIARLKGYATGQIEAHQSAT